MNKTCLQIASDSLRANIISLPSGKYLTAGQNQFQTLWTRDFCHAVRGLLAIGETETAAHHLSFLLNHLREDGLVPRVVDNHQVQFRVAWQSFRTIVPFIPKLSLREPLRPQYIDEHGSNAYDSNVLLILAALRMPEFFWKDHEQKLKVVWSWYDDKFRNGLLWQKSFSDWQDTTKREGHTFLLNFLYFEAASELVKRGWNIHINLQNLKERIKNTFFNGELYLSQQGYDIVSVEGNLFALESDFFLDKNEKLTLWENLKESPLMEKDGGVIGRCSYPDWPREDLAFHIKLAGLTLYHGSITWSWLMGLGLSTAILMKDEEQIERQKSHIERVLLRDGEVCELYDPSRNFSPWKSWLIEAEHPFAWGAGYLVSALKMLDERRTV